jgi:hypothetical protein
VVRPPKLAKFGPEPTHQTRYGIVGYTRSPATWNIWPEIEPLSFRPLLWNQDLPGKQGNLYLVRNHTLPRGSDQSSTEATCNMAWVGHDQWRFNPANHRVIERADVHHVRPIDGI